MLEAAHIVSLLVTLGVIVILGWLSTARVKNSSDFMVGGHRAGSFTVVGILTGTLIGGVSTIGTSQLGFLYGLSGFWFTLVLGISVMILGLMSGALKRKPFNTVAEILGTGYGEKVIAWASVLIILGMAINVASNLLAARSLLITITSLSAPVVTVIAGLIMILYIVFGGIWSGSWIGLFKTVLIYSLIISSFGLVIFFQGGLGGLQEMVQAGGGLNFFSRGTGKELAGGISVLIGVLSTQTYMQAIFSAKDVQTGRKGALLAGWLIIPVGLMGYLVGTFMRMHHPAIESAQALPLFILHYLPPWIGGVMFGGLLLSVVGGGAGLTLGISTVISNDLYLRLVNPNAPERRRLWVNRASIVLVIGSAVYALMGETTILMNELTYLSMGLRGATVFVPLMGALFFRRWIPVWVGYALLVCGAGTVFAWYLWGDKAIDPVYPALVVNTIVFAVGLLSNYWRRRIVREN